MRIESTFDDEFLLVKLDNEEPYHSELIGEK
jgi:hypothetical protein